MNLPKWNNLKRDFPAYSLKDVCRIIGGKVKYNCDAEIFKNVCAIRVSRALNGAGLNHRIPFVKNKTSSGENGLWHIYTVDYLIEYLTRKYGGPKRILPALYKKN